MKSIEAKFEQRIVRLGRGAGALRFFPDGIREAGRDGAVTFIAYADIVRVERADASVIVQFGGSLVHFGRDGSAEPYVRDIIIELVEYLDAKVAEARELADARAEVVAFLARGVPVGDHYRSLPAPRHALEAVARSTVMPAPLRLDAARALGDKALSEELSNASDIERRRV